MRHVVVMTLTGSVGLTFMFLVDAATLFWVSQLGDQTLMAAVGFAWVIQFFTISAGIGLAIAGTALVARAIGQNRWEDARLDATGALIIAFTVQAAVAAVVIVFRDPILSLIGASGEAKVVGSRFLLLSVPSLPIMALGMMGGAILRAAGDARRSMQVTLAAGAIAIVLDPFLILDVNTLFGFDLGGQYGLGLGVDGAAIGVAVSRSITGFLGIWYVVRVHQLAARPRIACVTRVARPFAKIAGPAIATQMSTPVGNSILTAMIAGYGDSAVAGWSVVSRLTVVAFGGIFALSGAIGGIIGQNYGAAALDRVRSTYRDALLFCTIYTLLTWGLMFIGTDLIVAAFQLEGIGADVTRAFTQIAAGVFVFTGALFVANAAFNNLNRPLWSTGLNWMRDAIVIFPCAWLLAQGFDAPGVVYGQALAGVIVGTIATVIGWRYVNSLSVPVAQPA
ncbi:putative MATE family efflux protein [Rubricella aquisinus]|uniref:Putative MATE family efflux protein n=1 Tax=Rubricella aquisinus TaxID=2028108 RepID=A0A840WLK8_9RHOB|nr:MATE family efflux transporter [Rubricella aquisinus]MBB5515978.1 putative MATE family efflux protein [Rubricella aquisinus]